MLTGIPRLKKEIAHVLDDYETSPIFTWCLRADYQIKRIYGSYSHILSEHSDLFKTLEESGDELAWHPHFWNFDEAEQRWFQELTNQTWKLDMLEGAFAAFQEVLPDRAQSVRMGWDYHDVQTFRTLQELGVKVDFSGIPRQKTSASQGQNHFDWYDSPNHPFFPATVDHRREASRDENRFGLLESPNFVSTSRFWSLLAGLHMARKMRDWGQLRRAIARPSYWIGISGKPVLFAPLVKQVQRAFRKQDKVFFVTYFHPDELLKTDVALYALEYVVDNVISLTGACRKNGVSVRFIRAVDIPTYL